MQPGDARSTIITALVMLLSLSISDLLWAATPAAGSQKSAVVAPARTEDLVDPIVVKYHRECSGKAAKESNCDRLRDNFVAILKEDLLTLGATAKRQYIPDIVRMFRRRPEVELRIAAADAIGMIGPQDQDASILIPLTNDPVPDVRHAVSSMLYHGKGNAISLLKQRAVTMHAGRTPQTPPDVAKFSMPVAPDSLYLFGSSDASVGRLSYVIKGKSDPASFFKAKAKKGPFKLEEFQEKYRFQIQDEREAHDQAQQAAGKEIENTKPPDPRDVQAYTEFMQKIQSMGAQQGTRMYLDSYEPKLFSSSTVYVLEERQIGQRSYPTRYVVLYQELAFKRPGYRLAWTTVPDDALKAAQVASLQEQREEEAQQAVARKEEEAAKKREAELEALTKKKDAAEKKQFKKGQEDLEKALGF
ncbi:MAG: hypothetical protein GDA67_13645 [Nitrospira sp. CR1.3]|nr:hypothetical protein [Nitrospira sp. CR1.3]